MSVDLRSLIGKLNDTTRTALEGAAGLCLSRTHYDVEVEHYLLKLLDKKLNGAPVSLINLIVKFLLRGCSCHAFSWIALRANIRPKMRTSIQFQLIRRNAPQAPPPSTRGSQRRQQRPVSF